MAWISQLGGRGQEQCLAGVLTLEIPPFRRHRLNNFKKICYRFIQRWVLKAAHLSYASSLFFAPPFPNLPKRDREPQQVSLACPWRTAGAASPMKFFLAKKVYQKCRWQNNIARENEYMQLSCKPLTALPSRNVFSFPAWPKGLCRERVRRNLRNM